MGAKRHKIDPKEDEIQKGSMYSAIFICPRCGKEFAGVGDSYGECFCGTTLKYKGHTNQLWAKNHKPTEREHKISAERRLYQNIGMIDNAGRRINSDLNGIIDSVYAWPIASSGGYKREQFYAELTEEEKLKLEIKREEAKQAVESLVRFSSGILDEKRDNLKRLKEVKI